MPTSTITSISIIVEKEAQGGGITPARYARSAAQYLQSARRPAVDEEYGITLAAYLPRQTAQAEAPRARVLALARAPQRLPRTPIRCGRPARRWSMHADRSDCANARRDHKSKRMPAFGTGILPFKRPQMGRIADGLKVGQVWAALRWPQTAAMRDHQRSRVGPTLRHGSWRRLAQAAKARRPVLYPAQPPERAPSNSAASSSSEQRVGSRLICPKSACWNKPGRKRISPKFHPRIIAKGQNSDNKNPANPLGRRGF